MLCKNIKSYNVNRALKKAVLKNIWSAFFDNMKYKKGIEILLKVIGRVYSKNPGMQTLIDKSMIDTCKQEGASPEQDFFLFFAVGFIVMDYLNINIFVCEGQLILVRKTWLSTLNHWSVITDI